MRDQWEKFRHRMLTKVFLGYAVVAWVLIQVIEAVLPTFETPLWVAQTITFLLILGFPVAIIVGWASEKLPTASNESLTGSAPQLAHVTPRRTLLWVGVGSCVVVGLFGFYMMPFIFDQEAFQNRSSSQEQVSMPSSAIMRGIRTQLELGETGKHPVFGFKTEVALSPDGSKLAYTVHSQTGAELYLRDLYTIDPPKLLANVDGPPSGRPYFSKNGDWVIYLDNYEIKRVRLEGGASQLIADANNENAGVSYDGEFVLSTDTGGALVKTLTSGGNERSLIVDEPGRVFIWPEILPGTTNAIATLAGDRMSVGETGQIALVDLQDNSYEIIIEAAFNARYSRSGHIVFSRDTAVWAVPFDIDQLRITGEEVPVIQDVETDSRRGAVIYSFSDDGRLVYLNGGFTGTVSEKLGLTFVDRNGVTEPLDLSAQQYGHLAVSPDEQLVAMTIYSGGSQSDIWVLDLERGTIGRRTFDGNASRSIWSADARSLIYRTVGEGGGIWSVSANGTEQPKQVFAADRLAWPHAVSSKEELVFTMSSPNELFVLDMSSDEQAEVSAIKLDVAPILYLNLGPILSPDGKWLAYTSNESGVPQVYVRTFPDITGGKWQISTENGSGVLWSKSSNEIFYWNRENQQFAVQYAVNDSDDSSYLEVALPEQMFSVNGVQLVNTRKGWAHFDKDDRFLIVTQSDETSVVEDVLSQQTSLVVVEDWFSELASLAPESMENRSSD